MKLFFICAFTTVVMILEVENASRLKREEKFKALLQLYKMNPLKASKIFENFSTKVLDPSKDEFSYKRYHSYENKNVDSRGFANNLRELKFIEDNIHQKKPRHQKTIDPPKYKVSRKPEDFTKNDHIYDRNTGKELVGLNKGRQSMPKIQDVMPDFDKLFKSDEDQPNYASILGNTLPELQNNLDTHQINPNYDLITNKEQLFDPDRHKLLLAQENLLGNQKSHNVDQNLASIYKKSSKAWKDLVNEHTNDKVILAQQYESIKNLEIHENADNEEQPSENQIDNITSNVGEVNENNDFTNQNRIPEQNQQINTDSVDNNPIINDELKIPDIQNNKSSPIESKNEIISKTIERNENVTKEMQAAESDFLKLLKPKDFPKRLVSHSNSSAIKNNDTSPKNVHTTRSYDIEEEDDVIIL